MNASTTQKATFYCRRLAKISWSDISPDQFEDHSKIHLFLIDITDYPGWLIRQWRDQLPERIQKQTKGFFFEKDKTRHFVAQYALRKILVEYSGVDWEDLEIRQDSEKKWSLVGMPHIQFTISHADEKILISIRFKELRIGMNIEKIKKNYNYQPISNIYFTEEEQSQLHNGKSIPLFFEYWTRKEALLSALGSDQIDEMPFLNIASSVNKIHLDQNFGRLLRHPIFYIYSFDLMGSYVASLALEAADQKVVFLRVGDWLRGD